MVHTNPSSGADTKPEQPAAPRPASDSRPIVGTLPSLLPSELQNLPEVYSHIPFIDRFTEVMHQAAAELPHSIFTRAIEPARARVRLAQEYQQSGNQIFGPTDWMNWIHTQIFQFSKLLAICAAYPGNVVADRPELTVKVPPYERASQTMSFKRKPDGTSYTPTEQFTAFQQWSSSIPPSTLKMLHSFYRWNQAAGTGDWSLEIKNPAWLSPTSPYRPFIERLFEIPPLSNLVANGLYRGATGAYEPYSIFSESFSVPLRMDHGLHAYVVAAAFVPSFGRSPREWTIVHALQEGVERKKLAGATVELTGLIDPRFITWAVGKDVGDPGSCSHVQFVYSLPLPSGREYRFVLKRGTNGLNVVEPLENFSDKDAQIAGGLRRSILNHTLAPILSQFEPSDFPELTGLLAKKGWSPDQFHYAFANPHWIEDISGMEIFERERRESLWRRLIDAGNIAIENTTNARSVFTPWATVDGLREVVAKLQEIHQPTGGNAQTFSIHRVADSQLNSVVAEAQRRISAIAGFESLRRHLETDPATPEYAALQQRIALGWNGHPEGIALDVDGIVVDIVGAMNRVGADQARDGRTFKLGSYDFPERFKRLEDLVGILRRVENNRYVEIIIHDPRNNLDETIRLEGVTGPERIEKQQERVLSANCERLLALFETYCNGLNQTTYRQYLKKERTWIAFQRSQIERLQKDWQKRFKKGETRERGADGNRPRSTTATEYRQAKMKLLTMIIDAVTSKLGASYVQPELMRIVSITDQDIQKLIYTVNAALDVIVNPEGYRAERKQKSATHGELNQGRNSYGAGELIFVRHNLKFKNFRDWLEWTNTFNFRGPWNFDAITNGSGHYRPSADLLPFVRRLIQRKISAMNLDSSVLVIPERAPRIEDTLTKGVGLSILI